MGIAKKQSGFTIVELLIVVIVIAILATITIVGFNGIQNRARQSAAASTLSQAHKAVATWRVEHSDTLPTNLSQVTGLGADSSWQYRRFDNNTQFCLSMVQRGTSYYLNSTQSGLISEGSCTDIAIIPGAGAPLGLVEGPSARRTFTRPVTGTNDVTVYGVVNIIGPSAGWNAFLQMESGNSSNIQMGENGAGSEALRYRLDTPAPNGSSNVTASKGGARTLGKHIGWVQISANGTVRTFSYDEAAPHNTNSFAIGGGWNLTGVSLSVNNSGYEPIAGLVYDTAHDQQTRARVMQWLADTYNIPMSF